MTAQNDHLDEIHGYSKGASSGVLIGDIEESSLLFSVEKANNEGVKVLEIKCLGEFNN